MGVPLRAMVREKEPLFAELGLSDAAPDDPRLLDAMSAHPIMINRPIVVTPTSSAMRVPKMMRLKTSRPS